MGCRLKPDPVNASTIAIHHHIRTHPGEEVTISYVGAEQLMPLAPRRKALRESFSFDCGCVRCAAEAGVFEAVGPTLEAVAEVGCAPAAACLQLRHFAAACLPPAVGCCWPAICAA